MSVLPLLPQSTLDYTGLSREDMLTRLQTLFNQLNPEWDDFSPAFPENLLLEGMTFIADLIRGTMEERTRQGNWVTVTDRLAAIRLGRLSGFSMHGASPATVTGTIALVVGTAVNRIPIPEGLKLRTKESQEPKKYRVTSAEAAIEVGGASIALNLEQAEIVEESFESTLEPNIEVLLGSAPFIDDSAVVTASDGAYTKASTFLGASSTAKVFVTFIDDEGRARIRFGNGLNGNIPQGTILVSYKVGGGAAGEVNAGAEWIIEESMEDELGNVVELIFTNTASSNPGIDAMSVEEARVRGPLSIRTVERLVTEDDFEVAATSVAGIARAFMATSNVDVSIGEDNGRLEVVALGTQLASGRYEAAVPTAVKLAEIQALMTKAGPYPPLMGFTFDVVTATLRTVLHSVRIFKQPKYTAAQVAMNVREAIKDFYAVSLLDLTPNPSVDFGARLLGSDGLPDFLIPWSAIFEAVLSADGVRYVPPSVNNLLIDGARGSVLLAAREFPVPGTITIFDEDENGQQI